jgi:hypothetical protein
VGPGSGLKDWLKSLETFSEFACTYCSICHNPVSSLVRGFRMFNVFNVRLSLSEGQQCHYYAVTCSVASKPHRPPLRILGAFDVRRVTTYLVGQ